MAFPTTPNNGDTHIAGDHLLKYNAATSTWEEQERITRIFTGSRPANDLSHSGDIHVDTRFAQPRLDMRNGGGWNPLNNALVRILSRDLGGVFKVKLDDAHLYSYLWWSGYWRGNAGNGIFIEVKDSTNGTPLVDWKRYRDFYPAGTAQSGGDNVSQSGWTVIAHDPHHTMPVRFKIELINNSHSQWPVLVAQVFFVDVNGNYHLETLHFTLRTIHPIKSVELATGNINNKADHVSDAYGVPL